MRVTILLLSLLAYCLSWKVVDVDRTIDVSSQIAKTSSLITFENVEAKEQNSVLLALPVADAEKLAYMVVREDGQKGKLKISKQSVSNGFQLYKIELLKVVPKGGQLKLKVESRVTQSLVPHPAKVAQLESQFVIFHGSAYFPAAYPVAKEKTTLKLASGKTLSATSVAPSKQETERVIYGPYTNQPAFNSKAIKVHYENNSPFVVATVVERTIEISHWGGNIAVEEYIELEHRGAQLKGTFSRLEHQTDRRGASRRPSVQHFTTVLPSSAKDIYYRDEIGNVTTSAVRVRADSVEVEMTPRFPLFGGWRTSYVIGYNVPSYEYLYTKDNNYALKMRVLDHILDNVVIEKLTTKVILPELVKKIKVSTPFSMDRRPDEVRKTYLDTVGRTVVILQKDNLTPDHIQQFTVSYEFNSSDMLREPLFATAFFFCLFLAVIVYVRFDFSIVADPLADAKEKLQSKINRLEELVNKKQAAYTAFSKSVVQFKTSRDEASLPAARNLLAESRNEFNTQLEEVANSLKNEAPESAAKALELTKYDKTTFDAADAYIAAVQRSQQKSGPEDGIFTSRVNDARSRAETILASL